MKKEYLPGSQKELKLTVNELGRELYDAYAQDILRWHFSPMFRELDRIDRADYSVIHDALYAAMGGSSYLSEAEKAASGKKSR